MQVVRERTVQLSVRGHMTSQKISHAVVRLLLHCQSCGDGWMLGDPIPMPIPTVVKAERMGLVKVERFGAMVEACELTDAGRKEARRYVN